MGIPVLINYRSNEEAARQTLAEASALVPGCELLPFDVANAEAAEAAIAQWQEAHPDAYVDVLVNNAGIRKTNTEGTERLARLLMQTGALTPGGRFVFVSSLSVMGNVCDAPQCDATGRPLEGFDRYRPFSEADVPAPNTDYGRSKLEAEELLARMPHLNYIVLRPTGVYGPRERDYFLMADSIRKHVDFAVGYTPQVITFIYVRDLVEACFLSLTRGERGKAYFLSDGVVQLSLAV